MAKKIGITETVLRDAHQSLLATRMTMDEMRPILPEMDKINYFLRGVLGRRYVRQLHPLPGRGSLGASAHPAQGTAASEAADAVPRPEYAGLPSLRR